MKIDRGPKPTSRTLSFSFPSRAHALWAIRTVKGHDPLHCAEIAVRFFFSSFMSYVSLLSFIPGDVPREPKVPERCVSIVTCSQGRVFCLTVGRRPTSGGRARSMSAALSDYSFLRVLVSFPWPFSFLLLDCAPSVCSFACGFFFAVWLAFAFPVFASLLLSTLFRYFVYFFYLGLSVP